MGLRTHNEPVTKGERAFLFASTKKACEDGYTPIKAINFGKPKKGGTQ